MSINNPCKKAQAWYIDFSVSLMIFVLTLVFYYGYINNYEGNDNSKTEELLSEARSVTSSLMLPGYPIAWSNETVIRIGLSDESRLNATKLRSFNKLNYSKSKSLLGTKHDFFVFFEDENEQALNIMGICGTGHPAATSGYSSKSAYYYSDSSNSFLFDFMDSRLKSDIFYGDDLTNLYDIDGLKSNLSKYELVVLENPAIVDADFADFKILLENYSAPRDKKIIISGQLTANNNENLLGADFRKKPSQLQPDRKSTANLTHDYFQIYKNQDMTFSQAYYVESTAQAKNFTQIATFDEDLFNAASEWKFGNGTVYFFSSFEAEENAFNLTQIIGEGASAILGGNCNEINMSLIDYDNLVKTERYIGHNSKIIKMKAYIWE